MAKSIYPYVPWWFALKSSILIFLLAHFVHVSASQAEEPNEFRYRCNQGNRTITVFRSADRQLLASYSRREKTRKSGSMEEVTFSCVYHHATTFSDTGKPGKRDDVYVFEGVWDNCSMGRLLLVNHPWRTPGGRLVRSALLIDAGTLEVLEKLSCELAD